MDNQEVFKNLPLDQFRGEWVVVAGGKMIGHAKDPSQLIDEARQEFPMDTPFILLVPRKDYVHYHTWR